MKRLKKTTVSLFLVLTLLLLNFQLPVSAAICPHPSTTAEYYWQQRNECVKEYWVKRTCTNCGQSENNYLYSVSDGHNYGPWEFYSSYNNGSHTIIIEISRCTKCNTTQSRTIRY